MPGLRVHGGALVNLAAKLLDLHEQGSLHAMDRGQVCLADGQTYPCATVRIIQNHALEGLMKGVGD